MLTVLIYCFVISPLIFAVEVESNPCNMALAKIALKRFELYLFLFCIVFWGIGLDIYSLCNMRRVWIHGGATTIRHPWIKTIVKHWLLSSCMAHFLSRGKKEIPDKVIYDNASHTDKIDTKQTRDTTNCYVTWMANISSVFSQCGVGLLVWLSLHTRNNKIAELTVVKKHNTWLCDWAWITYLSFTACALAWQDVTVGGVNSFVTLATEENSFHDGDVVLAALTSVLERVT